MVKSRISGLLVASAMSSSCSSTLRWTSATSNTIDVLGLRFNYYKLTTRWFHAYGLQKI